MSSADESSLPAHASLRPFLKQAAGIIAAEKGLTPVARAKLEVLAQQWKLSPQRFEEALQLLQSARPTAVSRYAQAFAEFLAGELERIPGDVLSPQMEARARQIASERFQLPPLQIEQLIEEQCEQAGVSRIQPDAAREYGRQLILQQLGDRIFTDEACCQQLIETGAAWGMDELAVDQIRLAQLAENRRRQRRGQAPLWRPVALGLLLLVATGVLILVARRQGSPPAGRGTEPAPAVASPAAPEVAPANLSAATRQLLGGQLRRLAPGQAEQLLEGMDQGSPEQLSDWVPGLLGVLLEAPLADPETSRETAATIAALVHDLPEAVSRSMIDQLVESLRQQDPPSIPDWKRQHRALDGLMAVEQLLPDPDLELKQPYLQERLLRELPAGRPDHRRLAIQQWSQLLAWSLEQPEAAATLVEALLQLSDPYLDAGQTRPLLEAVLLNILPAAPQRWAALQRPFERALEQATPAGLVRWVERVLALPDDQWPPSLAGSLMQATGVSARSTRTEDARAALQVFADRVRLERWQPLLELVERVDRHSGQLLSRPLTDVPLEEPDQIARQAEGLSLELACWWMLQGDGSLDDPWRQRLEQLLDSLPAEGPGVSPLSPTAREGSQQEGRQPTASDIRRRDAALARLADTETIPEDLRVLAVRQLQRVALRFDDLSYDQARALARFLLADLSLQSQLELQQLLASLSHWPNLLLALADEIETSPAALDQTVTFIRRLVPGEVPLEDSGQWRRQLRWHLIQGAQRLLAQRVMRDPASLSSAWNRLAVFLSQQYRLRLAGLPGDPATEPSSLPVLAMRLAAALQPAGGSQPMNEGQLTQLARNPLDQIGLAHQWASAGVQAAMRHPEVLASVLDPYRHQLGIATTAGRRLALAQRLLLETLVAARRQQLELRVGTSIPWSPREGADD